MQREPSGALTQPPAATPTEHATPAPQPSVARVVAAEPTMPCPVCGHPMPDLKGGKASICPVCGFKDSCCF